MTRPVTHFMPFKICAANCAGGNPHRGYLCRCTRCGGRAHGATKTTYEHLLEVVHHKLMDFTMPKAVWQQYLALQLHLLEHRIDDRMARDAAPRPSASRVALAPRAQRRVADRAPRRLARAGR